MTSESEKGKDPMNWTRLMLDAVIMAFSFNIAAIAAVAFDPQLMLPAYPKSIQSLAPPTQRKKRLHRNGMVIGMLFLMAFSALSACSAGVNGFWCLFFTFYIEWFVVSISDFFLLDIVLLQKWSKRMAAPGTEGHPDYEFKNWMRKSALPEHLFMWPVLMCPILGVLQAGAAWLFGQL